MGFSSFNCAISKTSIPACPYAGVDVDESDIIALYPDGTKDEGIYDGYGRIEEIEVYDKYHSIAKEMGISTGDWNDDLNKYVCWVKKKYYNGEKYEDLSRSTSCGRQGYFYSDEDVRELKKAKTV